MSLPRIYRGQRRKLLLRLVLNGVAQGAIAFALARLLREALAAASASSSPWVLVAGISLSGVLTLALRAQEAADAERLGQDYVMRVRLRIFDAIARQPARSSRRRPRWGVTMTRLISDLNSLRNWVSAGIARSIVASITLVALGFALARSRPEAVLAVVLMVGLCALVIAGLAPQLRSYVRESRRRRGRLANNLGEKMFAAETVRQFGHARRERRRVRSHSQRLGDALVRRIRTAEILRSVPNATLPIAIGSLVLLTAGAGYDASDVAVGVFLLGLAASALGDLARAMDYRLAFAEGRRRIEEVLDAPRLRETRNPRELAPGGAVALRFGEVRVEGRLAAGPFAAAPGELVAVVGPTGAGKSTLMALAARLLDPDAGTVEIDGIPVDQLSLESLYGAVQRVTPDLVLLRGTVGENLAYGDSDAEPEWIANIVAACGLDDTEAALEAGLDTPLTEQGQNLPDGLRARVALARAAIAAPRLLLIDHPVLLFEPRARAALQAVIERLDATVLVAAPDGVLPFPVDAIWHLGSGLEAARTGTDSRSPS